MPNYQDLQLIYINRQNAERRYWNGLVAVLYEFGEKFARHLDLPTPTYSVDGEDRHYLTIGQVNSLEVYRTFDESDFDRKERSIPIQLRLAVTGGNHAVRTVSIDLNISAQHGKTSFYSPSFPSEKKSIEYSSSRTAGLMDEIVLVLERQLEEA